MLYIIRGYTIPSRTRLIVRGFIDLLEALLLIVSLGTIGSMMSMKFSVWSIKREMRNRKR